MSATSTYVCLYTSLATIDRFLQIRTTGDSKPNDDDVIHFIEEVEAGIQARNLGSTTISGAVFDAHEWNRNTEGVIYVYPENAPEDQEGVIIVPPYTPIITLYSGYLYKNLSSLGDTTDWELLDEGPGNSTDYVLLRRLNRRTGKYLGYAIYFYDKWPTAGHYRLRAKLDYGENVDSKILQEYTTLQVAKKVITARLFSGIPSNVATYTGAGMESYTNTQYEAQLRYIDNRIQEIEKTHFPHQIPFAIIKGI